jgi:transcriptional regulator with XRE-family HTH domain
MRQLALRANLSVETVRRTVFGMARPEVETLDALADALGVSSVIVSSWVDVIRMTDKPWTPPAEAGLLTPKMRAALDQLIRAMAESEASSDAAPMNEPEIEPMLEVSEPDKPRRVTVRATPKVTSRSTSRRKG